MFLLKVRTWVANFRRISCFYRLASDRYNGRPRSTLFTFRIGRFPIIRLDFLQKSISCQLDLFHYVHSMLIDQFQTRLDPMDACNYGSDPPIRFRHNCTEMGCRKKCFCLSWRSRVYFSKLCRCWIGICLRTFGDRSKSSWNIIESHFCF